MEWVVYQVEYLSDVDGRGPECLRSELARFATEAEADAFVDRQNEWCEVWPEEV